MVWLEDEMVFYLLEGQKMVKCSSGDQACGYLRYGCALLEDLMI